MITHVVLFKFNDNTPQTIKKTSDALLGLKELVPVIRSISVGIDALRSERSYDMALTVRFDSMADLQAYQIHPAHKKVADFIAGIKESVAVVDYESE